MKNRLTILISACLGVFLFLSVEVTGQTAPADSLELKQLIRTVLAEYPSVQQATEALNAADLRIELAKSAYLPNADFSGSATHIGPVPSLTIPNLGKLSLAPDNNYNASVNVNQTISDFGKTRKNLKYEEENKNLTSLGIGQVKQKLSLAVIGCYYSLLYYQEAEKIKEEELSTLREHLKSVEKKTETGTATQYEILSTKVRISNIESQQTDITTAINLQSAYLNMLLGQSATAKRCVKKVVSSDILPFAEDSLINVALNNRNELKIAMKKSAVSQAYLDLVKSHENPVLSAYAAGGWKNGYVPELNKLRANYAVGLGLRIPIFDANRNDLNVKLAGSAIKSNSYEIDLTKRTISNEVMENCNALKSAVKKSELLEMQFGQAKRALELAGLKYKAGTLTNLDILDADNSLSESKLMLLKAKIDRAVITYKLKAAMGVDLY